MAGRWARGSAAAFYAGGMNSVQLVLLALLFGAAAGVGVFALISFAVRAGRRARAAATAQVLANALALLGVSAPEKM